MLTQRTPRHVAVRSTRHLREISQITPIHVSVIKARRVASRDGNRAILRPGLLFRHHGRIVQAYALEDIGEDRVKVYLEDAHTHDRLAEPVQLAQDPKLLRTA